MSNTNNNIYMGIMYLPGGQPAPEVLTEEETIKFLRLDINGPKDPAATLKHYRDKGLLRATRVGQRNRYLKTELTKIPKPTNRQE